GEMAVVAPSPKSALSAPLAVASGTLGASVSAAKKRMVLSAHAPAINPKSASVEVAAAAAPADDGAASSMVLAQAQARELHTERYAHSTEQPFTLSITSPLSTFSIDVDTASYANVRRQIHNGQTVEPGAVRVEEMINYFNYDYPEPNANQPFSVTTEVTQAPWAP